MSMQQSNYIIEVKGVSKFFGDKMVLDNINLYVKKGEFVTVLGPSGCGKTTLLRLIAGFQTASEGEIKIAGKEITQTPPHKRPVNTVFQKYALFPHLNVFDNIAFGLKLKKISKQTIEKKVKAALRMVGMTDYEYRDVNSLSGGQQQRVAIARAIVNEPEVLLLDEPLAALDLKMRKDMQNNVMEEIKRMFKPEFLNRIDDIIVFRALSKEDVKGIAALMLKELKNRLAKQMDITLTYGDTVKNFIFEKGYDKKYGARPLKRAIQNNIEDSLAEEILSGKIQASDKVSMTVVDGKVVFTKK